MKKFLPSFLLTVCLGIIPTTAFADSLQFVSSGGPVVNNVYIYPYNFSINGSSSLVSMLCLNYNREITNGEKWAATAASIPLDSSTKSLDYRALAILDYAINKGGMGYSISALQFADWDIFDPQDVNGNSAYTSEANAAKVDALAMASDSKLIASGFFNAFTLYQPTSDTTGWTNGIPQEFLRFDASALPSGVSPSLAPEPSSLVLLGSGLISVGGLVRRRIKQA